MKITLLGEPKSTQHIYGQTCRGGYMVKYMTKEGKALKEDYQWQAKSQWKKKMLTGDLSISVSFFFGTKRKADIDNFSKILFDALTGIVWEDDSQIQEVTLRKFLDKSNPRIEITI